MAVMVGQKNHSGSIPLLDMGVGPVYAPGEESNMNGIVYEFRNNEAAKSYVRLSRAAMLASKAVMDVADAVEVYAFAKRVRLPGSAFVARQFGRLEAWKAARVERQAQAAFDSERSSAPIRYTFTASGHESLERAFGRIEAAFKRDPK